MKYQNSKLKLKFKTKNIYSIKIHNLSRFIINTSINKLTESIDIMLTEGKLKDRTNNLLDKTINV